MSDPTGFRYPTQRIPPRPTDSVLSFRLTRKLQKVRRAKDFGGHDLILAHLDYRRRIPPLFSPPSELSSTRLLLPFMINVRHPHAVCVLLIAVCSMSGCVSRRMTIRSDPPGALVQLDGERIGYTPTSIDFTYYATREITLSKPGFETQTIQRPVPAPWYQWPPFDFFSDNILFFHLTNRHDFTYRLRPQAYVSEDELLERAGGIRTQSQVAQ